MEDQHPHVETHGCGGHVHAQHPIVWPSGNPGEGPTPVLGDVVYVCDVCGQLDGLGVRVSGRSPLSADEKALGIVDPEHEGAWEEWEHLGDGIYSKPVGAQLIREYPTEPGPGRQAIFRPTEAEEEEEAPDPERCGRLRDSGWFWFGEGHNLRIRTCQQCGSDGCPWLVALMALGVPTSPGSGEG